VADVKPAAPTDSSAQKSDSVQAMPADTAVSSDSSVAKADSPMAADASPAKDGIASDRPMIGFDRDGQDALTCTAEQERRRASYAKVTFLSLAETPAAIQDFLTVFLSKDYIEEHFRFFQTWNGTSYNQRQYAFAFVDGCNTVTVPGEIQWGPALYEGKTRYIGPGREWRILIEDDDARRLVVDAGCDASNLRLGWATEATPIPGVKLYGGDGSDYPAWQTVSQPVETKPGLPAGSHCYGPSCTVHAQTGAVSQRPGYCTSPA
jgi:hypothetical protein